MPAQLALVRVEEMTAVELFKPGVIDPILIQIKEEVRSQAAGLDISTEERRKQIASLSYKVARSKTFIDTQRKTLVADEKRRLAVIDKEGKRIWDELEALQEEVRKPLTEWENQDKERIASHKAAIEMIYAKSSLFEGATTTDIQTCITDIENEMFSRDFEEFSGPAKKVADAAFEKLQRELQRSIQADTDRAELIRLREEAEKHAAQEREAAIATAAREKAEMAAETERQRVAAETKRREENTARKAEQERAAIEAERVKAEQAKKDAEERARKAEEEKNAAIEAERRRVAEIKRKEDEEAKARERDKTHKATVNAEIRDAILANVSTVIAAQAEAVVKAIAKGSIPHLHINY